MRIGELARHAGMSVSAVRYYERAGLLPPPARRSGKRDYGADMIPRLRLARRARQAGLSIAEVRELVDAGPGSPEAARGVAARHAAAVSTRIASLQALHETLMEASRCCCETAADCAMAES